MFDAEHIGSHGGKAAAAMASVPVPCRNLRTPRKELCLVGLGHIQRTLDRISVVGNAVALGPKVADVEGEDAHPGKGHQGKKEEYTLGMV